MRKQLPAFNVLKLDPKFANNQHAITLQIQSALRNFLANRIQSTLWKSGKNEIFSTGWYYDIFFCAQILNNHISTNKLSYIFLYIEHHKTKLSQNIFGSLVDWRKNFSELYISHFKVDWMLLLRYCFVIFHLDLNLGLDTPNKVTNQSPAATTGPMRVSVWLLLGSDWLLC